MTFIRLNEHQTEAAALEYCEAKGLQVIELHRGAEGLVRGTALVGALPTVEMQGADEGVLP